MKASEVQIGSVYAVKVSGQVVPVQIVRTYSYLNVGCRNGHQDRTGWIGKNLRTGREIKIRGVQRIRHRVELEVDR